MPTTTSTPQQGHRHAGPPPGRRTALLWGSGAVAALILVLGTNGTLASWSSAVITNDDNDVATAAAVILSEDDGATTCLSSQDADNSYTCTTINKYGGTATPLSPGGSDFTDVTFANTGSADAASFALAPGTCGQTPGADAVGPPVVANLCTGGDLTVAVSCSPGGTYDLPTAWDDLVYAAGAPPTATKTHIEVADLEAADTWTCRITVALDADTPVTAQDVVVSQPLTWTLTRVA